MKESKVSAVDVFVDRCPASQERVLGSPEKTDWLDWYIREKLGQKTVLSW